MKRFLITFIIGVLILAFAIGKCNRTPEEDDIEINPLYSNNLDKVEMEEEIVEPVQHINLEKKDDEIIEYTHDFMVQLPSHIPSLFLSRTAYSLSYNEKKLCPNWVAWHLTAAHVDGEIARSNDYREDYDVPSPRATNEVYKGSSWSRGHMCPAGDCK